MFADRGLGTGPTCSSIRPCEPPLLLYMRLEENTEAPLPRSLCAGQQCQQVQQLASSPASACQRFVRRMGRRGVVVGSTDGLIIHRQNS